MKCSTYPCLLPWCRQLVCSTHGSAMDNVFMYAVAGWSHGMDLPAM